MIVKVSSGNRELSELLLRQSPEGKGNWKGTQFVVNEKIDRCDWWVVLHSGGLTETESCLCDPRNLVFVSMEPPDVNHKLPFLKQFNHIISCDSRLSPTIQETWHTWWVGIEVNFEESGHVFSRHSKESYDSLRAMLPSSHKANRISVITSSKRFFPGHSKRLKFLEQLRSHPISEHIDFYGGYHRPINDKLEALRDYKYHLAIENSTVENNWTEKLADPLLAYTLPLYHGCPNINTYFPAKSIIPIDINDFGSAVTRMQQALNENAYQEAIDSLENARELILNEYNIFNNLHKICNTPAQKIINVTLRTENEFKNSLANRIVNRIRRIGGRA